MQKSVMKPAARVVVVALVANMFAPAAYAQQGSTQPAPATAPVTEIAPSGPDPRNPLPHLRQFLWTNPGADRLVPESMVPKFGKGNEQDDAEAIQCVVLGQDNPAVCHKEAHTLWLAGLQVINDGMPFDAEVMAEIKRLVQAGRFDKVRYSRGYSFFGAMAWGGHLINGKYEVVSKGRPVYNSDKELTGYILGPFKPKRSSPYIGRQLMVFISNFCFNPVLELMETDSVVTAEAPPDEGIILPPQAPGPPVVGPMGPEGPMGPIGPQGPRGKKGRFPKWIYPVLGGLAGGVVWAALRKKEVVVQDARKGGSSSPGTRP